MGIVFDLIFVAIIIVAALVSAKHGFIRTLLELVGFVLAVVIAFSISTPIAEYTYDTFVGPGIVKSVDGFVEESTTQLSENVLNEIPADTKNIIEFFGITEEKVSSVVLPEIDKGTANISEVISTKILKPAITNVISTILKLILILILIPLFKLVAKLINKLFTFSFVGTLNKTLGGVLGVLKGVMFCVIICVVINFVLNIVQNGFWVITPENLEKSMVYSLLLPIIS